METSKLVSVIIPSLNRPDLAQRCLRCLSQQTLPPAAYEVILVENNARPDWIQGNSLPSNMRRLLLPANYGTTGSINRGIAISSSKYVLFLNNDVEPEPNYLARLISALEENHQYAFVTGKLLQASDKTRLDGAGDALLLGGGSYRLGHKDVDAGQFDLERPVLVACGAATLFQRSVVEELQGLDEDFFAYLDDTDLALRAQLLGHKGLYVPSAVAYHIGSATLGDPLHPKILELLTRNQLLLVLKNYPIGILLRLLPRVVVFQSLWLGFSVRRAALLPYMRGIWGALRLLPRTLRKRKHIMRTRRMSNAEFLKFLRLSEGQICAWHRARPSGSASTLLKIYFSFFGAFGRGAR